MRKMNKKVLAGVASGFLVFTGNSSATAVTVFTDTLSQSGITVDVTSTTTWQQVTTFGVNRMQFELDRSVVHAITFDLLVDSVDTTAYDCGFWNFGTNTLMSTSNGLTISTISRGQGGGGNAMECQISTSSGFSLTGTAFYVVPSGASNLNLAARVPISFTSASGGNTPPVQGSDQSSAPTPANYSGPELLDLSSQEIISGTSSRLEGKNLSSVTSIEIGGKSATFKLDGSSALDLTVPAGLAPGLYDLVINSPSGKLTHINAILVREPLRSFSITSRSEGRISEEHYQEHTIVASMQLPELNKARCVVNGPNLAQARAQAARLCALVKAANPNIQTTVVEARSTVRGNTVFARVSYGWTK
jgi:hypothetical protein